MSNGYSKMISKEHNQKNILLTEGILLIFQQYRYLQTEHRIRLRFKKKEIKSSTLFFNPSTNSFATIDSTLIDLSYSKVQIETDSKKPIIKMPYIFK